MCTIKSKRQLDINKKGRLFCSISIASDLRVASWEGKERSWNVCQQRQQLDDTIYVDVLERLEALPEEEFYAQEVRWHRAVTLPIAPKPSYYEGSMRLHQGHPPVIQVIHPQICLLHLQHAVLSRKLIGHSVCFVKRRVKERFTWFRQWKNMLKL